MGKFHRFLTELSAFHTIVAGYYRFTFILFFFIFLFYFFFSFLFTKELGMKMYMSYFHKCFNCIFVFFLKQILSVKKKYCIKILVIQSCFDLCITIR